MLNHSKELSMLKIIIIEDNIKLREIIKKALSSTLPFVNISETADGKTIFDEIDDNGPDLIIMDIRLPGENGLKLTKKIKKQYPRVFIAMNTNYDSQEYREAAHLAGADCFFSKRTDSINDIISFIESIYYGEAVKSRLRLESVCIKQSRK